MIGVHVVELLMAVGLRNRSVVEVAKRCSLTQKMSIYEVYYNSYRNEWRQKVMKTRPSSELHILLDELRQFKEQTKNVKGVDFTIAPANTKLRLGNC